MTQHANGSGAVPLPPIDPGNTFVLQRPHIDRYAREAATTDDERYDLFVMTNDTTGISDPVWQTANPATMSDGTKVLVITWRVGPGTLTARLNREDTVALGRDLIAAGKASPAALIVVGAAVSTDVVEVTIELDGCSLRMLWAAKDCDVLGHALVGAAQALSGLHLPGVHP